MSKSISLLSALICTFIWGTTFIAQDTGMELIGPYVFNTTRFFVGFLALIPFYYFQKKKQHVKSYQKIETDLFIYLSQQVFFYFQLLYFNKQRFFLPMLLMQHSSQYFTCQWFQLLFFFYLKKKFTGAFGHPYFYVFLAHTF